MIIVTRADASPQDIDHIRERIESLGLKTHISRGEYRTIIGCIGDEAALQEVPWQSIPGIESVTPILKPYRLASREFVGESRPVVIEGRTEVVVGGPELVVMAGPCAVEGREMLADVARAVADAGARMLRGGAFKPRTSPYTFSGLGREALEMLAEVRAATGMPVVTEVMDTRQVELVAGYADVLQVGARNMQNFSLLAEVGRIRRPVLLKRGMAATVTELIMAAEHIMTNGNEDVILCERGIRTFETATRNTLDVAAIPILKAETHLPVIVDPSHAAGRAALVPALATAAVAAGADGLIVEVHPAPETALSDGDQSLAPAAFADLMRTLGAFAEAAGRTMPAPAGAPGLAEATP